MYIPCQIMDSSSLESQAPSVALLRGLCCPCSSSRHRHERNRPPTVDTFHRDLEDPEMVFSRHRAAVIAGHRFLSNNDRIWNLQNIAPPLPQAAPPPLPARKLSSFFPPMEPFNVHRGSVFSHTSQLMRDLESTESAACSSKHDRGEQRQQRKKSKASPPPAASQPATTPPPLASLSTSQKCQNQQIPRGSTASIACPYLSPIDVAATSWEWDFGNNETLRSQAGGRLHSPSESGASNKVNIWGDPPVVKKGLLKQQREKMWSRWKERYFILTRDYLHCFRRLRNVYRFQVTLSAMGQFIYKLRLANIEDIRWDSFRSISRIALTVRHEATIFLRTSDDNVEALYHWFTLLQECICMSKIRRQALRVFNTTSEEDTTSGSDPSRIISGAIMSDDHNSHNSSYTLATSSPLSASSGQSDIHEIYRRVGSYQVSKPILLNGENRKKSNSPLAKRNISVNNNTNNGSATLYNLDHQKPRRLGGSSTSCGFYLAERTPSVMGGRPQAHLFNRFHLPALDSESELDDEEMHDIFEALPKRCANPTKEMEESSTTQSGTQPSAMDNQTEKTQKESTCSPTNVDYDDIYDLEQEGNDTGTASPPPRCESRVTLRDFVKTPWRSMSACLPGTDTPTQELRESSSSRLSAFPVPSRRPPLPVRSSSSTFSRPMQPPPGVFGGRKVLPTIWTKNNPTLQIGKGAAFARSNVIVCPSKISSDVTYLRRV